MRTLEEWFDEYSESHQNKTNIILHYISVPVIFLSIVGLVVSIPSQFLKTIVPGHIPLFENWAIVCLGILFFFYIRLSVSVTIAIFAFTCMCILFCLYIKQFVNLALVSFIAFSVSWVIQYFGHKIEGKKPAFFKDLQFLLISPAWLFYRLTI